MATTGEKKTERRICPVSPFTIEADCSNNGDVVIQSIPNGRLRGAVRGNKMVSYTKSNKFGAAGDEFIPPSGRIYGMLPALPGMRLRVTPKDFEYEITDPLEGNQELLDKFVKKANEVMGVPISQKGVSYRPVPTEKGYLDPDRMKTLVREMVFMVNNDMAKLVDGVLPDAEDIEELEGDFLLNPGTQIQNNQPKYEKDLPGYRKTLSSSGA